MKTITECIPYVKKYGHRILYSGKCRTCNCIFYSYSSFATQCTKYCWPSSYIKTKCFTCKKEIFVMPSKFKKSKTKKFFCSCPCYNLYCTGPNSPVWKGGTITPSGYRVFNTPKTRIRVWEHRQVMERTLGRKLYPFERVHHKNGIKLDNRPENLEVWTERHQPAGQRIPDLINFIKTFYPKEMQQALNS